MTRRTFAEALKINDIDIKNEYNKLHRLFFDPEETRWIDIYATPSRASVYDCCQKSFEHCYFRGLTLSLQEFNEKYDFTFAQEWLENPNLNDLVSLAEYIYNLMSILSLSEHNVDTFFLHTHINALIDAINYTNSGEKIENDIEVTIFVPKTPETIAVAESDLISEKNVRAVLNYKHHSFEGNVDRKRALLLSIYEDIEAQENRLYQANKRLKSDLYFLFNNLNIRHNNTVPESKDYKAGISSMNDTELEEWYDEIYRMCLLAILEIEHYERKPKIKNLKSSIETSRQTKSISDTEANGKSR